MRVVHCLVYEHNPWLVGLAALICALGSWVTVRLYAGARANAGGSRAAWVFLGAVAAGSSVWCTHFVAMLAFEPGVRVSYGPGLTALSLAVAVLAGAAGLGLATARYRFAPEVGGALLGAGIAAMHYTGMAAFAADGLILWNVDHVAASVLGATGLGAVAFRRASRPALGWRAWEAVGLLVLAIVGLHSAGMAALTILPSATDLGAAPAMGEAARGVLAVAVAGVGLLVLGTGAVSHLLDRQGRREAAARRAQEARIAHLAFHDSLTGLPNRAAFLETLHRALAARGHGDRVALLAIDLDRFKEVNDLHGHAAGDHVLKVVAERMSGVLHGGEFLARLGGDEFVAIATVGGRAAALDLAARLEAQLGTAIRVGHADLVCGGSVGIALCPDDATTPTALMNNADLALYRAKGQPTRAVCVYEEAMDEAVRDRRRTIKELRDAIPLGQLEAHYQIQVSVATGTVTVTGYEVLLRWNHPTRGRVPPSEFIPLAEDTGLILPIGEWVLRTACAEAASWAVPHKIAVNLSAVQLCHADLPRLVRQALADTGLVPSRLELEITESSLVADPERAMRVLRQLKALGVTVAMDDFGAGHSSLSTLRVFAFDKIKLDKSFMNELEASSEARAIIRAVLALGGDLGIPVLAEGVETADQLAFLREQGCDEAQGYLLGRPAAWVTARADRHRNPALAAVVPT